ncbi:MAG: S1 RNA-binding domain-containing protein [Candidatus Aminicenantes bacterium]|nr:S1 RNA-binding domain-containing protein [Candidatus Aminicenantes bacterium]
MSDNRGENRPTAPESGESFAEMLNAAQRPVTRLKVGEVTEGKIVAIGRDGIFLDLGTRADGMIEREEFLSQGELTVQTGDTIQVLVTAFRDGVFHCTSRLRRNGRGGASAAKDSPALAMLREAHAAAMPVEGKVQGLNKGGFDVQVMGQKAFCPISQIDRKYCQEPESHVGKTYSFLVSRYEEEGRNIVVSRRELLQAEDREASRRLWRELEEQQVRQGTVTSVHDYGAFVDLGGVEGLLHVSEISYQKIQSAKEALQPGQELRVAIVKLDHEAGRISLSLKALLADPWVTAGENLAIGQEVTGRVTGLKPFGAFVEVQPGLTGLLHVSRLGGERRVSHPREILHIGDEIHARILAIDPPRRTLSLTMEESEEDVRDELARWNEKQERESRQDSGAMAGLLDSLVGPQKE